MPTGQTKSTGPGDVVAVIPARGGSKGVPGKNLAVVGGRSLVRRAVDAARRSGRIDVVVVSTDDGLIAQEAVSAGARLVDRPADLAGDTASSESAVLHALEALAIDGVDPAVVVMVQCTSPFIDAAALGQAVDAVTSGAYDCMFSATETFDFLWRISADGTAAGVNHDASFRPRRQDRQADWNETGAFYVMRADGFRSANHRFFGRVGIEPVRAEDSIEIDTPSDLELARALASLRASDGLGVLAGVTTLVTDFDGVHTDDTAWVDQDGRETVRVNRRDGHGIKLLRGAGVRVLVLSTETNPVVARRAEKLQVECLHGIDDKAAALAVWLDDLGIPARDVAYLGNDVNDLGCLEMVGFPISVADAHPAVAAVASHTTAARGGAGAVREVAEAIIAGRTRPNADP